MRKAAFIFLIGISSATWAAGGVLASDEPDPTDQCLKDKTSAYYNRKELAVDLANLIALECAELLPQFSPQECQGKSPFICSELEKIHEDTNYQKTELMRKYAYQILVMFRQPD